MVAELRVLLMLGKEGIFDSITLSCSCLYFIFVLICKQKINIILEKKLYYILLFDMELILPNIRHWMSAFSIFLYH